VLCLLDEKGTNPVAAIEQHLKREITRWNIMTDIDPKNTFRGLPLTSEQDAEVRHYIKVKKQHGEPWDTPELNAMLKDMLTPPSDEEGFEDAVDETKAAAERAAASIDEAMDPIVANEERNAAMESEGMKGPKR
jgi:hypothetical protein